MDRDTLLSALRDWPGARTLPAKPREHAVRDGLAAWLTEQGIAVVRERPTNGDYRIDIWVPDGGFCLELKVKIVHPAKLVEQLAQYAADEAVREIIVVTWNCAQLPQSLSRCGKPVFCLDLAGALFG